VFQLSGGVPRIMNVICDRALLGAFSQESRLVNKRLVRKAASEVSGQKVTSGLFRWLVPILGVASLALAASVLWPTFDNNNAQITATNAAESRLDVAPSNVATGDIAPVPEMSPTPDLDELLATYDDTNGFEALLGLWGARFDPAGIDGCRQAEAQGLSCSYQRGTWTTLRQLDRPVMLTLTGNDGETHVATLLALDTEIATLSIVSEPLPLPIEALSAYWFGQFVLIWKPANGSDQPIGPGMENENVRWLRQSLAVLNEGYQPVNIDSAIFDDDLQVQLTAFQRKHRLDADGVAGEQTQVIINSLLTEDGTPRLSDSRQAL
jgi:general secretion pathway protein A